MKTFQQRLIEQGYCDERGAGFCATATSLPNNEHGLVALCVNGNTLSIYDTDLKSNIQDLIYKIDLKSVEKFKIKSSLFNKVLSFTFNGCEYSFTNLVGLKSALQVIEEEALN